MWRTHLLASINNLNINSAGSARVRAALREQTRRLWFRLRTVSQATKGQITSETNSTYTPACIFSLLLHAHVSDTRGGTKDDWHCHSRLTACLLTTWKLHGLNKNVIVVLLSDLATSPLSKWEIMTIMTLVTATSPLPGIQCAGWVVSWKWNENLKGWFTHSNVEWRLWWRFLTACPQRERIPPNANTTCLVRLRPICLETATLKPCLWP